VPHACMRRAKDPNHDAGIRIGSKLRGGGPILTHGIEAKLTCGTPPPRTVIGDPSEASDRGRNHQVFLDRIPPLVCRTEDDAFRHNAIADEVP
jgi:hypothetical protein